MGLRRPPKKSAQTLSADAYAPVYMVFGYFVGGVVSPLLANVFLHYVLDLWSQRWRTKRAEGDAIIVRYADDSAPRRREGVSMG